MWRPADANETAAAWIAALNTKAPTAMVLSRQGLPVLEGTSDHDAVSRGGYVLVDTDGTPDAIVASAGSEVQHGVAAAAALAADGINVRVVSLPCWDEFERQDDQYRSSVLPSGVPTITIEAGTTFGWARYGDTHIGIDRFGASAPGSIVMEKLGITADAVIDAVRGAVS